MTMTHSYWEIQGETEPLVYFDGYSDLDTYSGVDCRFIVSIPREDDLEEYGWSVPDFAAQGHFRNGIAEYSSITIPREELEFLDNIETYQLEYPSADLQLQLERLERDD